MIRVIDADVLMESLKRWRDEWAPVNIGYIAINEVISNIEKMPTVDAIPVEWLIEQEENVHRKGTMERKERIMAFGYYILGAFLGHLLADLLITSIEKRRRK